MNQLHESHRLSVPRPRPQPLLDLLLALRHADDAADVLRRRQAGVRGLHDGEVGQDVVREGRDLAVSSYRRAGTRFSQVAATQPSVAWRISM